MREVPNLFGCENAMWRFQADQVGSLFGLRKEQMLVEGGWLRGF
jgi:hypothetical protein